MTGAEILMLAARGETLDVEFKGESKAPLNDRDLVEAVACMANRAGAENGWVLIGVEDDGTITGARPRHGSATSPNRLSAMIMNQTVPSVACAIEVIPVGDVEVIAISVPPSRTPVGTSAGTYLRRTIGGLGAPECKPLHFHDMANDASGSQQDYAAQLVPNAAWGDLDPLEIERFRRTIRESRGSGDAKLVGLSDVDIAKALGAVEANHRVTGVTVLGLLLFGKEEAIFELLPTHELAFQVLSGTRVETNDFFRWPLVRFMDELLTRFRARNKETELSVGLLRVGVPEYSEVAFREGIANALIHRDYRLLGAVHVQWHADRLEIANPGGFPEGVNLNNLLVTPPRPRNPRLADAFRRAGLVERSGRGVDTIFLEQLRNGRPAPSYDRTTENHVVLALPGGEANLEFVRLVVEEGQAGVALQLDDLLLLNCLWHQRRLTTRNAATALQKSDADARATLARLVERALVEPRGEGKSRSYQLSASTYRRLGDRAAYQRQRGFQPIQQDAMVRQFVEQNGRITRREVAELCRVLSLEARSILKRLVKAEELEQVETGRRAYYVLRHEG